MTELEATPNAKTCVSKILKKITIAATGGPELLGAIRDPLNAGERKVDPQTNTDGEHNIRQFDDPKKKL